MFQSYLISAFRFIIRNKLISLVNILGLSLGLAAGTYILMFILNEVSFDRFNKNLENIYRITWRFDQTDVSENASVTTAGIGPSMLEEFPEVQLMTRFANPSSAFLQTNEKSLFVDKVSYADSSFFRMFSYELIQGNPFTVLKNPFEIVLSESLAQKIYGERDPIGQIIRIDNEHDLLVTGIFYDLPPNSHLLFDALISFSTLYEYNNYYLDWDGGHNYYTYVQLLEGSDLESMTSRFPDFMERHLNYKYRNFGMNVTLFLQPLKEIHLHSYYDDDVETRGSMINIYILSSIVLLILLMACINFINLSTARALKRAREIGIRRLAGATRSMLIRQFMVEASLFIIISFFLSLILIDLFQPWFNQLVGKDFHFFNISNSLLFTILPLLLLTLTLVAGGYPAFYLSHFLPITVMKGISRRGYSRSYIRNILVVFQFFITAVLIASSITIFYQLNYVKKKSLGYQKDNLIVLPLSNQDTRNKYAVLREELLTIPGVLSIGGSSDIPGFDFTRNGYFPEGFKEPVMINVIDIDPYYLETMKIPIKEGRNFERGRSTDSIAYIVNEALIRSLNLNNPLEMTISRDGKHPIIGVVKDFHFASMHKEIAPLILTMIPWGGCSFMTVRINSSNINELISSMEERWRSLEKTEPFNYFFLETYLKQAYQEEMNFNRMVTYFGIIAIVIACLGLLGLSSYLTEQRRKEVGIRKVFGAPAESILLGYAGNFLKIILIANILAMPVIWYSMTQWLERFAYRIDVPWIAFIFAFLTSSLISLVTISVQVIHAAQANPIESLKAE